MCFPNVQSLREELPQNPRSVKQVIACDQDMLCRIKNLSAGFISYAALKTIVLNVNRLQDYNQGKGEDITWIFKKCIIFSSPVKFLFLRHMKIFAWPDPDP